MCTHAGCGGVCADTWTDANSDMLCKDLACGRGFTGIDQDGEGEVTVLAMYPSRHTTNLTGSITVENKPVEVGSLGSFTPCSTKPAVVVCSGNIKYSLKEYPHYI